MEGKKKKTQRSEPSKQIWSQIILNGSCLIRIRRSPTHSPSNGNHSAIIYIAGQLPDPPLSDLILGSFNSFNQS